MKIVECDVLEFRRLSEHSKVICYGGRQMAAEAIRSLDIGPRVSFLVDSNPELWGRRLKAGEFTFDIVSPEALAHLDGDEYQILITSAYAEEILQALNCCPNLAQTRCYVYSDMIIRVKPGTEEFFEKRILSRCLELYREELDLKDLQPAQKEAAMEEFATRLSAVGAHGEHPFVVPQINYYLTTRCNLRCRGCSALIDYVDEPADVPAETVLRDFTAFLACVDECVSVEILGGETFLYPYLGEVLDFLVRSEKIRNVIIPTNCAVLPKAEVTALLKNEKVILRVSDYGQLDKMGRFIYFAEQEQIKLQVLTGRLWDDPGGLGRRGKSPQQLRRDFMHCDISRYVKVMENGKLHICERSARMYALGRFTSDHDYIALHESGGTEELRQKIKDIYYADYADICDYCDRGSIPKKLMTGGVQLVSPFHASEYAIIKRDRYARLLEMETEQRLYTQRT